MFVKRKLYSRRRIVGGSLLGNLFSKAKNTALTASKYALSKLPNAKALAKLAGAKALEIAKKEVNPEKVKDIALDYFKGNKASAKQKTKALATDAKKRIAELATSPQVKKALEERATKLITDNSRALLSNLLAGSGMKRIK